MNACWANFNQHYDGDPPARQAWGGRKHPQGGGGGRGEGEGEREEEAGYECQQG